MLLNKTKSKHRNKQKYNKYLILIILNELFYLALKYIAN